MAGKNHIAVSIQPSCMYRIFAFANLHLVARLLQTQSKLQLRVVQRGQRGEGNLAKKSPDGYPTCAVRWK